MYRLFEATNSNEIEWKLGADESYFAVQKDANLHLRTYFDSETGEFAYIFRVVRGKHDASFVVSGEEDDFGFMRNLYSAISVNAAGEDFVEGLFD